MDGRELLYNFREVLGEPVGSGWLDTKSQYYFLDRGGIKVAELMGLLHAEQSITTVADQRRYNLDAQYIGLHIRDESTGDYIIKYNDGSTDSFLPFTPFTNVITDNQTSSTTVPDRFSISDRLTQFSRVTGTTTSAGAIDSETSESTLTASADTFSTDGVSPRDVVHSTSNKYSGYVLEVSSETALITAMFDDADGSTKRGWGGSDTYAIQPQPRKQLVLDPPPSTASHTITVFSIVKPLPVFSDFRTFGFSEQYCMAAVYFAASIYKRRDKDFEKANDFFQLADNELRLIKDASDTAYHKSRTMRVNMKKRR